MKTGSAQPVAGGLALLLVLTMLSACTAIINDAKQAFADDLSVAILQHNEPETIEQALPAYLVLVDSMVRGDDRNIDMLMSASKLYGAYTSVFVTDPERKQVLSERAFMYAHRALCLHVGQDACDLQGSSYAAFEASLEKFTVEDVPVLFALGNAWATRLQANTADWNAVAELPRVKALFQRLLQLDERYSNGDVHVYMGVMESLLPPAMGGKPELAKQHFEQALKISDRTNPMALLMYAEKYARLVFDQARHDALLQELLRLQAEQTPSRLITVIAQAKAKTLLAESADYF